MWIYIPLVCPPAKTRLLKRTETVTIDIDIILIIGFQKKKLDVQLEKNLLPGFDLSKAKKNLPPFVWKGNIGIRPHNSDPKGGWGIKQALSKI